MKKLKEPIDYFFIDSGPVLTSILFPPQQHSRKFCLWPFFVDCDVIDEQREGGADPRLRKDNVRWDEERKKEGNTKFLFLFFKAEVVFCIPLNMSTHDPPPSCRKTRRLFL